MEDYFSKQLQKPKGPKFDETTLLPIQIHVVDGQAYFVEETKSQKLKRLDKASSYVLLKSLQNRYTPKCYIYIGYSEKLDAYKIGHTQSPEKRAAQLKIKILHTIGCFSVYEAKAFETELHWEYRNKRLGRSEWFKLEPKDLTELSAMKVSNHLIWEASHEGLAKLEKSTL